MDHTVVHFEIPADDPERALKFYRELFGWEIQKWSSQAGPEYWSVSTVRPDGKGSIRLGTNGGILRLQHAGHVPVKYVSVESVDQYIRKATLLGGKELLPKTPVPGMGWFAWLSDTEGNAFGIWQSDERAA